MFPKIGGFHPKSSILIEFFIINHPFWGAPIFGNTHICVSRVMASFPFKRCGFIFWTFFYVLMSNNKMDIFTKLCEDCIRIPSFKIQNTHHSPFIPSSQESTMLKPGFLPSKLKGQKFGSGKSNTKARWSEFSYLLVDGWDGKCISQKCHGSAPLAENLEVGCWWSWMLVKPKILFFIFSEKLNVGGGNWSNLISMRRNHQLDSLWWWRDDERMVCHP